MLNDKESKLLNFIKQNPLNSSKEIFDNSALPVSYATIKRILTKLIDKNLLSVNGRGRSSKYIISPNYELFYPIDVNKYFEKEIDERKIKESFSFSLISNVLTKVIIFSDDELHRLYTLHKTVSG